MAPILCMLLFLICWLTLLIVWIISFINKFRLKKLLDRNHSEINHCLTIRRADRQVLISAIVPTIQLFFSFWSYKVRRNFWNQFVDIFAVEGLADKKPKRILKRLIFLSSLYFFTWWTMIISIIIALLTWNQLQ